MKITVSDFMITPIYITATTIIRDAAIRLEKTDHEYGVVVDDNGLPLGIVTRHTLLSACLKENNDTFVSTVMSQSIGLIDEKAPLSQLYAILLADLKSITIVIHQDGTVHGLLTPNEYQKIMAHIETPKQLNNIINFSRTKTSLNLSENNDASKVNLLNNKKISGL